MDSKVTNEVTKEPEATNKEQVETIEEGNVNSTTEKKLMSTNLSIILLFCCKTSRDTRLITGGPSSIYE